MQQLVDENSFLFQDNIELHEQVQQKDKWIKNFAIGSLVIVIALVIALASLVSYL